MEGGGPPLPLHPPEKEHEKHHTSTSSPSTSTTPPQYGTTQGVGECEEEEGRGDGTNLISNTDTIIHLLKVGLNNYIRGFVQGHCSF